MPVKLGSEVHNQLKGHGHRYSIYTRMDSSKESNVTLNKTRHTHTNKTKYEKRQAMFIYLKYCHSQDHYTYILESSGQEKKLSF